MIGWREKKTGAGSVGTGYLGWSVCLPGQRLSSLRRYTPRKPPYRKLLPTPRDSPGACSVCVAKCSPSPGGPLNGEENGGSYSRLATYDIASSGASTGGLLPPPDLEKNFDLLFSSFSQSSLRERALLYSACLQVKTVGNVRISLAPHQLQ